MIFNIVVDAVMQAVLDVVCVPQEAQQGLGWVAGDRNLIFYADGNTIAGQYHKWFQDALLVTMVMYHRMGLGKNIKDTKIMVYTPGSIRGKGGEKAYKRRATGERATFWERKRLRVSFTECRVTVAKYSLKQHMASQHGICVLSMRGVEKKV